jgi:hypothetical protein
MGVDDLAFSRFREVCTEHSEVMVKVWAKSFAAAATVWAAARAAGATIRTISTGWLALADFAHLAPNNPHHMVLRRRDLRAVADTGARRPPAHRVGGRSLKTDARAAHIHAGPRARRCHEAGHTRDAQTPRRRPGGLSDGPTPSRPRVVNS